MTVEARPKVIGRLCELSIWQSEAQSYIRLELGGVVVLAVRMVAPFADGCGGGVG